MHGIGLVLILNRLEITLDLGVGTLQSARFETSRGRLLDSVTVDNAILLTPLRSPTCKSYILEGIFDMLSGGRLLSRSPSFLCVCLSRKINARHFRVRSARWSGSPLSAAPRKN
jgi:hypothetical protein